MARRKSRSGAARREPARPSPATSGDRAVLYATVTITGAAIMMLEILGTRIIGPFYGVSLFVWSSLISVALIALSIGYYLGGIVADRFARFRMSYCVALAALFAAMIPAVREPVLLLTNPMGVRGGAFVSALILFSLPLTLLAMIGPRVIKLSARGLANVGTASGTVYAVSTVGSVVGTLVLGFFLLPNVGTRFVLYSVSATLFGLSIGLAVFERRRLGASVSMPLIIAVMLVAGVFLLIDRADVGTGDKDVAVRYESESHYGRIRVLDDRKKKVRWLLSDSSTISGAPLGSNATVFPYLHTLEKVTALKPEGKRALLIGLGGGYLPMALQARGVITDSIEIDPQVAHAAREFFGFESPGRLIIGDARYEIRRLSGPYDFIIHDCFSGGVNPTHLLSVEMMRELRRLLSEDGVLALNYFGFTKGARAEAVAAVDKTLGAVFLNRRRVVSVAGAELSDNVFFASMRPLRLAATAGDDAKATTDKKALRALAANAESIPDDRGFVITDDFNPLEYMQVEKAEAYRDKLLALIGTRRMAE